MRSFAPARFTQTLTEIRKSGPTVAPARTGPAAHPCRAAQTRRPQRPDPATATSNDSLGPVSSFEAWVQRRENQARSRFAAGFAELQPGAVSGWFARMLDSRILPALEKIGFDAAVAKPVMALAAPVWECMGPMPAGGIRFHPGLTRLIEEVRSGTRAVLRRQSENRHLLENIRPSELFGLASANAEPARLISLLEIIAASWLILPRTYRTLTVADSQCLPVYLSCLENEPEPEFRQTLSRVVIEYIGNFSRKHRRSELSEEKTAALLFFGYAAMFWKNLRQPPTGRQDDLICDSFFRWALRMHHQTPLPWAGMQETVADMASARQRVFPRPDAFGRLSGIDRYHPEASLMALRHGAPGIASVLRCLGPSAALYPNDTALHIPYNQVPATLQALLRTIQGRWAAESPATGEAIRRFLSLLADRYRTAWKNALAGALPAAPALRFTTGRISHMIRRFCASLP